MILKHHKIQYNYIVFSKYTQSCSSKVDYYTFKEMFYSLLLEIGVILNFMLHYLANLAILQI